MITEVNDMQELSILSDNLLQNVDELEDSLRSMKSIINRANNYDGIDVKTAANILKSNLTSIMNDARNTARNIKNYTRGLNTLNTDDFPNQLNFFSLDDITDGIGDFFTITLPASINDTVGNITNAAENIAKTIFAPITMIVNKINIVEEPTTEVVEEESKEIPLYDQTDYDNVKYGTGTIATSGCGITCVAMLASYYTGEEWTPDKCAALVSDPNLRPKDNVDRMLMAASKIGLNYEQKTTKDIMPSLQEGKNVIALVNNSGHFVVLRGLTEDGKVLVNDPYGPWQTVQNTQGQTLTFNEAGYIVQNDINLTSGRIWVFDGTTNNSNQSTTV